MITIKVDWQGKSGFQNLIRYLENIPFVKAEAECYNLAERTITKMIRVIEDERIHPARPTLNNIANSLGEPEELVNNPGRELMIGIGNIDKLNEKAKHWELIDRGGTYITKETHVVPTNYFAGAKSDFLTFKKGSSHTIEGIEFVYKSIQNLEKELKETITELGGSFISGLSKASK